MPWPPALPLPWLVILLEPLADVLAVLEHATVVRRSFKRPAHVDSLTG